MHMHTAFTLQVVVEAMRWWRERSSGNIGQGKKESAARRKTENNGREVVTPGAGKV